MTIPFPAFISFAHSNTAILRRLFALRALILCSFILYTVGFDMPSPTLAAVGVIVLSSALFSLISWRWQNKPSNSSLLTLQLLWDSAALLIFVWFAGGSTNPFIYYQLLVIAISASLLPEKFAWMFAALGIVAYSVFMYLDLGHHMAHMDASFKSHLIGMWINFSGSALLIAFFISRLSLALKKQETALRLAREDNLKNEQLIGIGALAASTVHSFGTPLSTIRMATGELDAMHKDHSTRACTTIINAQIERCKATMKKLTALTARKTLYEQSISINELSEELNEYLQLINAQPMPELNVKEGIKNHLLPGGNLLLYALINLVDNAVSAANRHVAISISGNTNTSAAEIIIEDDGGGIPSHELDAIDTTPNDNKNGLGLGLLLVNSTIEQLGGTVGYRNPSKLNSFTQITVNLPFANSND